MAISNISRTFAEFWHSSFAIRRRSVVFHSWMEVCILFIAIRFFSAISG